MDTPLPPDCQQVAPGWRANDLTLDDIRPLLDNFVTKFLPGAPDECWLWTGTRMANGYGVLGRSNGAGLLCHRVAYVAFTGNALADNLTVDHLCNVRHCVNPAHLEPVTLHENVRRRNERLGYDIGGKSRPRGGRPRTRPQITGESEELRAQRARENSLAYYHENRERVEAVRRVRVQCEECGQETRRDGLRRHRQRMHGAA